MRGKLLFNDNKLFTHKYHNPRDIFLPRVNGRSTGLESFY